MTKLAKWTLAAAFAVAAAGEAQAQRGGGGGGGGQRGGQGGQRGGQGQGMGMQQPLAVTLLTNVELQKELKITDDEKKALKDVMTKAEELAKERAAAFGGGGGGGGDRQAMQEKSTKLTEEAKAAVDKALTEDQKKRLKQIEVQAMGMRAFTNEDVVKALKISDDQKGTLKTISDEAQKDMTALRTEYGLGGGGRGAGGGGGGGAGGARPDPEKMAEYQKKSKAATDEAMAKVTKALTDDQKKAWKELTGEPFDVSKLTARPMRRDN